MPGETTLTELQTDIGGRLSADSYFSDVAVIIEDKENLVNEIAERLSVVSPTSNKFGICALVRMPVGLDDMPDVYFSPLDIDIDVTVIELPTLNRDTANGGTGKPALAVARRAYRILKNYVPGGLAQNLVPQKQCIVPTEEFAPLPAYNVRFVTRESDPTVYTKCATPVITPNGGVTPLMVTVTCATAGVTIFGTFGAGFYPWNGPPGGPFGFIIQTGAPSAINAPATLRVAATKAGMIDSDVAYAIFT